MVESDLSAFTNAKAIAQENEDRGALRALVWNEKVTKILSSAIKRYDGDNLSKLQDVNIYVCEICGFVSFGKEKPDICPVCKVPKLKITEIKRRKA